jgi:hypothetical protein
VLVPVLLVASGGGRASGLARCDLFPVDLRGDAVPDVLATAPRGCWSAYGTTPRRHTGLLRLGAVGSPVTEAPLPPETGYGRTASWYSLTSDDRRILAIGDDRGGAHGNVQ